MFVCNVLASEDVGVADVGEVLDSSVSENVTDVAVDCCVLGETIVGSCSCCSGRYPCAS